MRHVPRHRATRLELERQLLQILELLDRFPEGLSASEIRAGLSDHYDLRLDARLLRLRLTKLLSLGDVTAEGATRGRRYNSAGKPLARPPSRLPGHPRSSPPSPPRLHQDLFAFDTAPEGSRDGDAERARHVSSVRWRGEQGYFIEYDPRLTTRPDSMHVGPTGRIPTFASIADAVLHAQRMGFAFEDATTVFGHYDLDHVHAWCANPRPEDIEYELFIHVLGLIAELPDIEFDEELSAAHDASDVVFTKLLKSTDPRLLPGEPFPYIAEWTPDDITRLKRTFDLGVYAFVNRLVAWPPLR